MKAISFQVQNYRNIDDSGPIPLERVTNFVGRNESGKTALLKALHKFNPATEEPYDPQKDFPRDRYTRDYISGGSKGKNWPVCSVLFQLEDDDIQNIGAVLPKGQTVPKTVKLTKHYDNKLRISFEPPLKESSVKPDSVAKALNAVASAARRIKTPAPDQEDATQAKRQKIADWATGWQDKLKPV
jgi:AAA15 family ATPase/GTPase